MDNGLPDPRLPNQASRFKTSRSLSIAIWLIGSLWAVAILAHVFDAPHEITYAALAFGLLAGIIEWLALKENNR